LSRAIAKSCGTASLASGPTSPSIWAITFASFARADVPQQLLGSRDLPSQRHAPLRGVTFAPFDEGPQSRRGHVTPSEAQQEHDRSHVAQHTFIALIQKAPGERFRDHDCIGELRKEIHAGELHLERIERVLRLFESLDRAARITPIEPALHHRNPCEGPRAFRIVERRSYLSLGWPEAPHRHECCPGLMVQIGSRSSLTQRLE
jgi:hypothetical protein